MSAAGVSAALTDDAFRVSNCPLPRGTGPGGILAYLAACLKLADQASPWRSDAMDEGIGPPESRVNLRRC